MALGLLAMQVGPGADGIQKLLAAEAEAQQIVKAARDEKLAKIKQAQSEAEREVASYKAQREDTYRQMMEQGKGDAAGRLQTLTADTDSNIAELKGSVQSKKKAVVSDILGWVCKV